MLSSGTELVLVPEKPVAGGRMLARHEGRVVLVRGAIPGERVRARVERVSRDVAYAAAVDVIERHPDRREPPVDPMCGGNTFAHIAYGRQLALKSEIVVDAFARLAHLSVPPPLAVLPSPERGYRMRARFHVRGPHAGFYREGTHDLCDPAASGQLQPEAISAAEAIARALYRASGDDAGDTLGIELAENIAADVRAVHVELRDERAAARLADLGAVDGVSGLSWSLVSHPHTHVLAGSPYVVDGLDIQPLGTPGAAAAFRHSFGDESTELAVALSASKGESGPIRFRRHVRAFFQGNRYLVSELVQHVLSLIPDGPVIDLYAGVGLFAAALASTRQEAVVAVEGDAISAADLRANAAACVRPFATHHVSVEEFLRQSGRLPSHTMVVDPPRTGLSPDAVRGIRHHHPRRLVYVSCDVATLARDAKLITKADYRLTHVELFDLFPNTPHVETIAVLDRD